MMPTPPAKLRAAHRSAPEAQDAPPASPSPPAAGHNLPAPSLGLSADDWARWMDHVFDAVTQRADDLLAAFARFRNKYPDIPDDEVQGRAGDLRRQITELLKQAERLHGLEKAPVLTAAAAIDGALRRLKARLGEWDSRGKLLARSDAPLNVITTRQTAYAVKKEEQARAAAAAEFARRQAEADAAAERAAETLAPADLAQAVTASQAADTAARDAAAPTTDLSRVHGEHGSVTSLRGTWRMVEEESDLMTLARAVVAGKAPLAYLDFNRTRIGLAIRVEKVREIPGCVIKQEMIAR